MKIPNADRAYIDIAKLREYCLDPMHPRGRHKAHVFAEVLGLTEKDADYPREALYQAVNSCEAEVGEEDQFGRRYFVDYRIEVRSRWATVRSVWMVRTGESFPRLVSCYII